MKIAICDDEKEIREMLGDKMRALYPEARLLLFQNGEELLRSDERIDIVLLDIQMPGRNGMETAEELRRKNRRTVIIFITALEDYVFEAFDVGAFHYLVKPFSDQKFEAVMRKAVRHYEESAADAKEKSDVDEGTAQTEYIIVQSGGKHRKVLLRDIVYAEVFNRIIVIHKMDEDIRYYGKLADLEAAVGDDFFRPHRSYLIHLKYVDRYDSTTVYLEKGKALMAKQNYSLFVKKYMKYIRQDNKKGKNGGLA